MARTIHTEIHIDGRGFLNGEAIADIIKENREKLEEAALFNQLRPANCFIHPNSFSRTGECIECGSPFIPTEIEWADSIEELGMRWIPCFNWDLEKSMLNLGSGYDPYNHVGYDVVSEVIGA